MSRPTSTLFLATLAALLGCEGPQGDPGPAGPEGPEGPPAGVDPAAPAIDKLLQGAGGRDALAALAGFTATARGERLMTLEGLVPEDDSHPISTFTSDAAHDLAGDRFRVGYTRTIPLFGAQTEFAIIGNGDRAVLTGVESAFGQPGGDLTSDRWASTLRQQRLLHPQILLHDLARGAVTATDAGYALRDGELRHRIELAAPLGAITLYVDRQTGELTDASLLENDYTDGDALVEAHYLGWRTWDDGAVRAPAEVAIAHDAQLVHVETRQAIDLTPALDPATFTFPDGAAPTYVAEDAARGARNAQFHEGFASLGVPLDGLQTNVVAQPIGTGVWHLAGGSHHSLAIEQSNGVVIVEGPLYEARAQAIYAWVAATIGKPITHVVVSHHHRDHAGALRTFVARGAKVVVGAASAGYFAGAFRAARTVQPDELAAMPRPAIIEQVPGDGRVILPDAVRPVHVVAIASSHAADLVVAYVPAAKLVFVSDIYSPFFPANPFGARELRDGIVSKNLDVQTIAGGHGGVGPRSDLDAIAAM